MKKLPEIIYKYRSWNDENHKKMLTHNQLYLSAPNDFNDPFDCKISINFHLLNSSEKIEKYIEKLITQQSEILIKKGYNIEERKNNLRNELKDINKYQRKYEKIYNDLTNKYLGVLSFSIKWNSILMWSHYGNFHKGYCIGFDEEKMRNTEYFNSGGEITYNDEMPQIDPLDDDLVKNSFLQTHYKAKDWFYEQEYRLAKLFIGKSNENSSRIIEVPDNFIREVIIGINTTKNDKQEIYKICKSKNIPIYQAYKDSFNFEIKRKIIK